jgi:hypothetical protein
MKFISDHRRAEGCRSHLLDIRLWRCGGLSTLGARSYTSLAINKFATHMRHLVQMPAPPEHALHHWATAGFAAVGLSATLMLTGCSSRAPTPEAVRNAMQPCTRRGPEIPGLMQRATSGTRDAQVAKEAAIAKSDCEASLRALKRIQAPASCVAATQNMVAITSTLAEVLGGKRQDNWQGALPGYGAFSDLRSCAVDAKLAKPDPLRSAAL